jgi:hypothetical protein
VPSTAAAPAAHQPDHIVDLTIDDVAQLPATNRTAAQHAAPAASIDTQIDTQIDSNMQDAPSLPGTAVTAAQDPAFAGVATNALTPDPQPENMQPATPRPAAPRPAAPQPATPQPVNPQPRVNHLKIDSSEFKVAVEVPRLGMDRILHSAMLHGKLNDLLERGLISYDAARAAFRQAQHNQIGR